MSNRKLILATFWLLVAGFFLVSCDTRRVYDTYKKLPNSEWNADSLQFFSFNISNTSQNHNLYFNIRNDRSYGFSNLWLFVKIIPPEGEIITDTIQVLLANPSGKWLGKGFTGIYTSQIPYRTHVYFPVEGNYTIQIQHGMRQTELKGITDIGFRVEKARQ
jgi:gliding motility-associated lipoprotein GldH